MCTGAKFGRKPPRVFIVFNKYLSLTISLSIPLEMGLIGLKWAYFYGGHSCSTFAEFPKNWRFLHPDTHTSVWISECKNVSFSKNFATYYDNDPIRTFCAVLTNGRFSYNHNLHNWVMLDCKQRCYWKISLEKKC